MPSYRHKRGTLAQITAAAGLSQLKTGEVYFLTDLNRLAVASSPSQFHQSAALVDIGGGSDPWTYVALGSNFAVSTTAYASVTGVSFTGTALAKYEVEVFGAYQSAATTTGMALALDVPAGASVIGSVIVHSSGTALTGLQQIADATATGVSAQVATANSNTPVRAKFLAVMGVTGGTVQLMARSEIAASAITLQSALFFLKYRTI